MHPVPHVASSRLRSEREGGRRGGGGTAGVRGRGRGGGVNGSESECTGWRMETRGRGKKEGGFIEVEGDEY